MAKINIPFLVPRKRSKKPGAKIHWFWQPSATLRKAGWISVPLGTDFDLAVGLARKENTKVEEWRNGGATPAAIRKHVAAATLGKACRNFEESDHFAGLKPSTQREYRSCLRTIDAWGGKERIEHITRQRVQVLKAALMKPPAPGAPPRYARAKNVLSVLYNVLQIEVNADRLPANPAAEAGIVTPPPRQRVITTAAIEAIAAQALQEELPEIEFATRIGFIIMQREADVLHLTEHNWKELEHDVDVTPEDWPKLVGADGRVFGFSFRQRKTNKANRVGMPIKVPVVGDMRRRVEATIAAHRELHPARLGIPLVLDPDSGDVWPDWKFQRRWRAVVNAAIETAKAANDVDLVADLTDIEFRDLRRSGMVHLFEMGISDHGITAISGHKIERTKKILETYGPRNTRMASGAVAQSVIRMDARRAAKEAREKKA